MLGNKVAEGVYQIEEPTLDTIKPLLIKAKMLKLEPEFYEWLVHPDFQCGAGLFTMNNGERVVHTSPGTVEALKQTLELIQKVCKKEPFQRLFLPGGNDEAILSRSR